MSNKVFIRCFVVFCALLALMSSCSKTDPTVAVIIVKEEVTNDPVNNATVTLSLDPDIYSGQGQTPIPELNKTKTTDQTGRVEFTYDQELIIDVSVVKYSGNDTLQGYGVVKLLAEQTTTKIITIYKD